MGMLSPRNEPGLKLYARKVLIQEHNTDLLPEYLHFIQGVVDSEDLPLNVSRESYQANTVMANLKKTLTNKVLSELSRMARKKTRITCRSSLNLPASSSKGWWSQPDDRERIWSCSSSLDTG
jgi:HSP90 family molecular chaperone